jgi:hypothetical protein
VSTRSRFGSQRSKYRYSIGADVFTSQTSCPPGQHYEPDAGGDQVIRGIGKCVPNVVALHPLTLHFTPPAATQTAPAPMPSGGDRAAAPTPAPTPTPAPCPDLWPWWWLLVAFGVGAAGGYYVQKNQSKAKKNAGRIMNAAGGRIVNAAGDAAMSRLLG